MLCPRREVRIIPITWFINELQVKVQHFDASTREQSSIQGNLVFSNIKKALNPNITEPIEVFSQQIKINSTWVALEVALLGTQSKFGQFVITLNYVCKFSNLMMTPIRVRPYSEELKQKADK